MLLFTFFTETGTPKTGLSATITVWEDAGTVAVNAQAMTEIAGGWYKYDFSGYDNAKDYVIRADGSASLGDADRYKYSANNNESACGTALDAYDPPTKTELDSGFAGLNDLSAADVNAECDQALVDYDPPTRAELTTDKDSIITEVNANETKIDVIDTVVDSILVDTGTDIPASLTTIDNNVDTINGRIDQILSTTESDIRGTDSDSLKTLSDQIDDVTTLGPGAITWTYTVTDSGTGLPMGDVNVWVTTDEAGSNVIASGTTNQNGVVTFYLDAGTVYIWCQKSGYNFTNPDTEVVS